MLVARVFFRQPAVLPICLCDFDSPIQNGAIRIYKSLIEEHSYPSNNSLFDKLLVLMLKWFSKNNGIIV